MEPSSILAEGRISTRHFDFRLDRYIAGALPPPRDKPPDGRAATAGAGHEDRLAAGVDAAGRLGLPGRMPHDERKVAGGEQVFDASAGIAEQEKQRDVVQLDRGLVQGRCPATPGRIDVGNADAPASGRSNSHSHHPDQASE